jgi:hypothetical protein
MPIDRRGGVIGHVEYDVAFYSLSREMITEASTHRGAGELLRSLGGNP